MKFILIFISCLLLNISMAVAQGTGCASAVAVTINGICVSGTISDATQDAPNITNVGCPTGTFRREGWYKFTVTAGPQNITVTGSTAGQNLFLQILSETSACTGLAQIACANNTNSNGSQTETVNLPNLANGTYYVKVVNVGTNANMTLNSLCITSSLPPANDACSGAISVSCGNSYTGSTIFASTTGDPSANCANGSGGAPTAAGVWYSFAGIGGGQLITASLCNGTSYDTKLHVYSGNCAALTCETSDDNGCGSQSTVTFTTAIGTTYYILVNGASGATGTFSLAISCITPPANDPCSGSIPVSCGNNYNGTTVNSTTTGDPTANCGAGGAPGSPGVWYSFIGAGQIVTANLCTGTSYDTKMNVYSGSCVSLTCVDSNDDACNLQSSVTFTAANGITYYILVNGYGGATGAFTLNISCCVPAAPGCVGGLSPVNGASNLDRCTSLSWTAPSSGACNPVPTYSVFFGTSPVPAFSGTTSATSYTFSTLSASTTYYWSIVPFSSSGTATGCSTQSFSTNSMAGCVGPGGVASGLSFWVKANAIASLPADNTAIATWDDRSGASRNATQSTASSQPVYRDNTVDNINYNPILNWDSNDDYMGITANGVLPINNDAYAVYAVIAPDNSNNTDPGKFFISGDAPSNSFCAFDVRGTGVINDSWNNNDLTIASQWTNLEPLICSFNYNTTQRNMYKNGILIGTLNTTTNRTSTSANSAIGYLSTNNTEFYGGKIAEIISYKNLSHNTASRENVESYLGIKYGKTLPHHYYAASGTPVYSVVSPYNVAIIGIGREDLSSFIQKQSKTVDDSVRIYKGTLATTNNANNATFLSDVSYVVLGANTGKLCNTAASNAEKPAACGLYSRLEREWKVTKTNFAETFNMDVKLNSCAIPGSVNTAHLRLLVDDDGNFGNGGTTCYANGDGSGVVFSYANPVITISGISNTHIANNTTQYITVASINPLTPLPLELLAFTADCEKNKIRINWSTASEINNDYYDVQRSTNGIDYITIGRVSGHGTTTQQNDYSYIDQPESVQEYYYRLKQVNADHSFVYYKAIVSGNSQCGDLQEVLELFPNPANEKVSIRSTSRSPILIEIINDCGQLVYSDTVTNESIEINTSHFASGIYTVRMIGNTVTVIRKLGLTH